VFGKPAQVNGKIVEIAFERATKVQQPLDRRARKASILQSRSELVDGLTSAVCSASSCMARFT